jgi:hypothetical protein
MSEQESKDSTEELFRYAVIGQYLDFVNHAIYDRRSWNKIEKSLQQERLREKRMQTIQTIGLLSVTIVVSLCIFFKI